MAMIQDLMIIQDLIFIINQVNNMNNYIFYRIIFNNIRSNPVSTLADMTTLRTVVITFLCEKTGCYIITKIIP
jgi:hypothetical protein